MIYVLDETLPKSTTNSSYPDDICEARQKCIVNPHSSEQTGQQPIFSQQGEIFNKIRQASMWNSVVDSSLILAIEFGRNRIIRFETQSFVN
ncbi:hypothetical protein HI914_00070 [Erysiphe necator]|nr:hypothetical protein HI914_00070 [Erysiphe necator]